MSDTRFTLEQIARALNDHASEPIPAYVWHSGGGVFLVRVDVAPLAGEPREGDPYLLLSPREDFDSKPGVAIGYYPTFEHEGHWPDGGLRFADTPEAAHAVVLEGADLLSRER